MLPIGHYRDIDDPDSFVWLRGFDDMERRRLALEAFYLHSDAWRANRDAANATMIDSDNVLLLRPLTSRGFDLSGLQRPPAGARIAPTLVAASVLMLQSGANGEFLRSFAGRVIERLGKDAARVASLVTEEHPNTFPRLPVRENERALVFIGVCADSAAVQRWRSCIDGMVNELGSLVLRTEHLRLQPAARSLLR
jgi:hypothetical protein